MSENDIWNGNTETEPETCELRKSALKKDNRS